MLKTQLSPLPFEVSFQQAGLISFIAMLNLCDASFFLVFFFVLSIDPPEDMHSFLSFGFCSPKLQAFAFVISYV